MTARRRADRFRDYRITPIRGAIAILASGGLDSSVLLAQLASTHEKVFPLYVRTGLRWEKDELQTLRRFIKELRNSPIRPVTVIALPMTDLSAKHWSVTGRGIPGYKAAIASNYIPGRNLSLLAKAAIFCARERIGELAMAPLEANPFPDARPEFFRAFARAVELGIGLPLKIITPYIGMSKAQVITMGARLPLRFTVSCIRPRGSIHCGKCTKCAERIKAFRAAGITDPSPYLR